MQRKSARIFKRYGFSFRKDEMLIKNRPILCGAHFREMVTRRVPEIISRRSQVATRIFRIQDG